MHLLVGPLVQLEGRPRTGQRLDHRLQEAGGPRLRVREVPPGRRLRVEEVDVVLEPPRRRLLERQLLVLHARPRGLGHLVVVRRLQPRHAPYGRTAADGRDGQVEQRGSHEATFRNQGEEREAEGEAHGGARRWPTLMRSGSGPIWERLAAYHSGQAPAMSATVASWSSRRAAMSQSESPGPTVTAAPRRPAASPPPRRRPGPPAPAGPCRPCR